MRIPVYALLTFIRAWQRQLHALVKDPQQKAEIYGCLWMLLNEDNPVQFQEKEQLFLSYWADKQPNVVQYYQKEYSKRAGQYSWQYY